ncbi:MAG TPA: cytosine permease [Nevskiaceae bacterium]|nr:cytosine permease [Nevskiaceae bacterium]
MARTIENVTPELYNEDLAPAQERKWGVFSVFNVWTSDVHSLWGYYLAASLFLLCGGFWNFIITIGLASLVIFAIMLLIGFAGARTGLCYPVLARASFGVWGANLPALIRAVVACFWYGAQTALAADAVVALLIRAPGLAAFNHAHHWLGHPALDLICFIVVWLLQLLIIQHGMETVRRFQNWAGPAVWLAMLALAVWLTVKAGGLSVSNVIPHDDLLKATHAAGVPGEPGSIGALMAVGATWITYFAALFLNFCDFSRFTPSTRVVRNGSLWGLPVNLVLFSLVSGVTTIAAYRVYGEVLLHPEDISAKFSSLFLATLAALVFAVATLGINVVANFVSPAFDISNTFPHKINFKRGGYIAAIIALCLYPFAPWNGNAAGFVNAVGSLMGPLLGVILVDYYLIARGHIKIEDLFHKDGLYRFHGGWSLSALGATGIGALFSTFIPLLTDWLPSWWGTYGWFFGVAVGSASYWLLSQVPRLRHPCATRAARQQLSLTLADSRPSLES